MKKVSKTLLTATLILGLPLGAYAASEAAATANPGAIACPMDGSGKGGRHHGGHHDRMAHMQSMTPEQIQANLQKRYDRIEDSAKKAEFIKILAQRADGMLKHAEAMKQFAEANQ